MGPRRCNIEGCKSVAGRQQHRGVTFHTFPTNPSTRANWMKNCRFPPTKSITKSVLICSRHFRRADFQPLKNNKYLLKSGSEPTIFPWTQSSHSSGSNAAAAAAASALAASTTSAVTRSAAASPTALAFAKPPSIKRSVSSETGADGSSSEPLPKQLRKSSDASLKKSTGDGSSSVSASSKTSSDPEMLFCPGAKIEAQDFTKIWHAAQVMEVDQIEHEVLVHFETAAGAKLTNGADEWIPMNSSRLRARRFAPACSSGTAPSDLKSSVSHSSVGPAMATETPASVAPSPANAVVVSTSPSGAAASSDSSGSMAFVAASMQPSTPLPGNLPVLKKAPYNYVVGERCMAKWTDSRRWKATVQTVLDLDYYDILFDDGYSKRCHAKDMSKIKKPAQATATGSSPPLFSPNALQQLPPAAPSVPQSSAAPPPVAAVVVAPPPVAPPAPSVDQSPNVSSASLNASASSTKGRKNTPLPIPKFDLAKLNLKPVPTEGEWCCNWVNDTPIGDEGFLEGPDGSRRPTVLVSDWRLPTGWTKHLYQRSTVSGKWDVVLVGPSKKRFRSKNDVKQYLDEFGLQYNPDVYDFSIHKRRAKDLGMFVFTDEYRDEQIVKQREQLQKLEDEKHAAAAVDPFNQSSFSNSSLGSEEVFQGFPPPVAAMPPHSAPAPAPAAQPLPAAVDPAADALRPNDADFVYVGSLRVRMQDNLFCCPDASCNKNFRKENHLQIHVKHYHAHLAKQMGECLNMSDLAYIRTTGELPSPEDSSSAFQIDGAMEPNEPADAVGGASTAGADPAWTSADETVSDYNRTSTPLRTTTGQGFDAKSLTAKKYKKTAKKIKKIKTPHSAGSSLAVAPALQRPGRRQLTSASYDDGDGFCDTDYVPEGIVDATPKASGAGAPAIRSNRIKFLQHATTSGSGVGSVSVASPAIGSDPNAAVQQHVQAPAAGASNVYVDENGDVIKLVRMRQEEIINCVCAYSEEDGLMIQCELCLTWQHGRCQCYEKESAVPDKYVCSICQNPKNGRPSMRFVHDQEWLYEGRLPTTAASTASAAVDQKAPLPGKLRERFALLKQSHTLTGNLLELKRFMHSLQVKINIAENKDHPKMYLWARPWEKNETSRSSAGRLPKAGVKLEPTLEEEQVINDLMCDADAMKHIERAAAEIAKAEIKTDDEDDKELLDGNILAGLLTSPGGTNIDLVGAERTNGGDKNAPFGAPQPEAAIDSGECQLRLLDHIQRQQMQAMSRLDSIEADIIGLEAMEANADSSDESDNFGTTKRQIFQLISDLTKMRKLASINLSTAEAQDAANAAAAAAQLPILPPSVKHSTPIASTAAAIGRQMAPVSVA